MDATTNPMAARAAMVAEATRDPTATWAEATTSPTAARAVMAATAVHLGMSGLTEMMMPDPATDGDQESSYLFNGAEQNIIEGDPVPVLYGHLRVPGQPISFDVISSAVNPTAGTGNSYGTNVIWHSPDNEIQSDLAQDSAIN